MTPLRKECCDTFRRKLCPFVEFLAGDCTFLHERHTPPRRHVHLHRKFVGAVHCWSS